MKSIKKVFALLLAILMILSVVPIVSAADVDTATELSAEPISIEVFDMQSAKTEDCVKNDDGKIIYNMPEFSYIVTFDDGSQITKSSIEEDVNLSVSHNQENESWKVGTFSNKATVYYGSAKTEVAVPLLAIEDFGYYVSDDGIYINEIYSFTEEVEIPETIDDIPVVGIGYIEDNSVVKTIKIPASMTYISSYTFDGCHALTNIVVAEENTKYASVEGILYNKTVTSAIKVPNAKTGEVVVPVTVQNLDALLSANITIVIDPESEYFSVENNIVYNRDKTQIVSVPKDLSGSYTIPNTVTEINNLAFAKCKKLVSVKIPSSVTSISYGAFADCTNLNSVTIPKSVTAIEGYAFAGTTKLKSVTLPSKLKSLGEGVFKSGGITSVTIPNTVTQLEESAFANSKLASVKIGTGIKTISGSCFKNTPLKSVAIPNTVTEIWSYAFNNCKKLETVTLGTGLLSIGYNSFEDCIALKKIVIPNKVETIGDKAFDSCTALASLKLGTKVRTIGECAFYGCAISSLIIPDSVTSIYYNAFSKCKNLTKVTIGSGLEYLTEGTFIDCDKLTDITVSSKNKKFSSYNGSVYTKKKTKLITCPGTSTPNYKFSSYITKIGLCAFQHNSTVKNISVPNTVTEIGYGAFANCSQLTKVVLSDKIKTIGPMMFINDKNLISVTIPKSVKTIDDNAFHGCDKLINIYFTGTKSQWNAINISKYGNDKLKKVKVNYNSKGCTSHVYDGGADLTCNKCGYLIVTPVVRKVSGKWYYFNNAKKVKLYTGMHKIDGKQKYIKNGVVTANLDQPVVKLSKTSSGVKISWKKVNCATKYKVYRSTYSKGKWSSYKLYKTTTSLSYVDKNVRKGAKVRYTVYAYNSTHSSKYKKGVSITYK